MSTSYYHLREPVTALKLSPDDEGRTRLEVEVRGYKAGSLLLDDHDVPGVLLMLSDSGRYDDVPVRTSWGGEGVGCQVTERVRGLDPNLQLVSEYGELMTLAEIRVNCAGWKP